MARKDPTIPAHETIEEIDGFFDRLADWTAENSALVWGVVGGVLAVALIVSLVDVFAASQREEAAEAVGTAQAGYLEAMGAPSLQATFTEPANPESARATRERFAAEIEAAAKAHPGSASAAAGYLEIAGIRERLDDPEGATAALRKAAEDADGDSALRAVALVRLASALEDSDPAEASRTYERAAEIDDYPSADTALAHAARTALDAGDTERALALFATLETRSDDNILGVNAAPPYVLARLREARAAAATAAEPAATP